MMFSKPNIYLVLLAVAGFALVAAQPAEAEVVYSEDFESYTPDMDVAGQSSWEILASNGALVLPVSDRIGPITNLGLPTQTLDGGNNVVLNTITDYRDPIVALEPGRSYSLTFDAFNVGAGPGTGRFGFTAGTNVEAIYWRPVFVDKTWTFEGNGAVVTGSLAITDSAAIAMGIGHGTGHGVASKLRIDVNGPAGFAEGFFDFGGGWTSVGTLPITSAAMATIDGIGGIHDTSPGNLPFDVDNILLTDNEIPSTHAWAIDASDDWNASGSWLPATVPNSNSEVVRFGNAITAPRTVTNNAVSTITVNGIVFGDANAATTQQSYTIDGSGSLTLVNDPSAVAPKITVLEGSHTFQTIAVNLSNAAEVNATSGTSLTFANTLNLNNNTLTMTGLGTVNINGTVNTGASGSVVVTAGVLGGTGTIAGDLANSGGTVGPGLSPGTLAVTGDYFQSSGSLSIEIDGIAAGTQYDEFNVTGDLTISGGSLDVVLGFPAVSGATFDILDFSTMDLSGATINLGSPGAGLAWDTSQFFTNGTLGVTVPGDFNGDFAVTIADYTVMKANWLSTGNLPNQNGELTGDGIIDIFDFKDFKENVFPGGLMAFEAALAAAVPEPSTALLLLTAVPACLLLRFRSEKEA